MLSGSKQAHLISDLHAKVYASNNRIGGSASNDRVRFLALFGKLAANPSMIKSQKASSAADANVRP